MENMRFVFMHSLKEIAMRRMAINLWIQPDILVLIENFSMVAPNCRNYSRKWRKIVENKVIDKLLKLALPVSLTKQLLLVVTPIGLLIQRWKDFHQFFLELPCSEKGFVCVRLGTAILEKLRWTAAGTIDYRLTAEELIRCKMVNIEKCYRLACLYCLEDCIPLLWEELSEGVKRTFYNGSIEQIQTSKLPYCWPYILKGEQSKLEDMIQRDNGDQRSFNRIALGNSAFSGNKFATEFFLQKLSNDERNVFSFTKRAVYRLSFRSIVGPSLLFDFPTENSGYVLSYLLSLMNYEEQMQIIQIYPVEVLICFLDWPSQDIFLKIANLIWGFLSTEKYDQLLDGMSRFFRYSNYSYPKFFQECFTGSPIEFRKRFVDYECRLGEFFPRFFDIQDSDTIEVILRNSDAADRVRLVSSERILKLFYNCLLKGRLQMVQISLREARLSKEDRERVREAFMEFQSRTDRRQIDKNRLEEPVWIKFLQILDETGEISQSKRTSEDETQNKAKKLCSDE